MSDIVPKQTTCTEIKLHVTETKRYVPKKNDRYKTASRYRASIYYVVVVPPQYRCAPANETGST